MLSQIRCTQHLEESLLRILLGKIQPSQAERAHMVAHLKMCADCRTNVGILGRIISDDPLLDPPIRKFLELVHRMVAEELLLRDMGAFLEAWELKGFQVAETLYPVLAHHLRNCHECRHDVELAYAAFHHDVQDHTIPSPDESWLPDEPIGRPHQRQRKLSGPYIASHRSIKTEMRRTGHASHLQIRMFVTSDDEQGERQR